MNTESCCICLENFSKTKLFNHSQKRFCCANATCWACLYNSENIDYQCGVCRKNIDVAVIEVMKVLMQNGFESVFGDKMTPSKVVHQICIKYLDSRQAFPESPTFQTQENIDTIFSFINFIQDYELEFFSVVRIVQLAMDFKGAQTVHFVKLLEFVVDYQIKMAPSFLVRNAQLIWDSITVLLNCLRNENIYSIVNKLFKYIVGYCNDVFLSQGFMSFFNDAEPVDVAMLEAVFKTILLVLDFVEPTQQFLTTIIFVLRNNFHKCFQYFHYFNTDIFLSRLLQVLQKSMVSSVNQKKISESASWVFHEEKTVFDLFIWFGMSCSHSNKHINSLSWYLKIFSTIFAEQRFCISRIGPNRLVIQLKTLVNSTTDARFVLRIADMVHAFAPKNRKQVIDALWKIGFENNVFYAIDAYINSFNSIQAKSDIMQSYFLLFTIFKTCKFYMKKELQNTYKEFKETKIQNCTNKGAMKSLEALHDFVCHCCAV